MLVTFEQSRRSLRAAMQLSLAVAVLVVAQSCSRPESPTAEYVQGLTADTDAEPEFAEDGGLVLPFTPEDGRIADELTNNHPSVLANGVPAGQAVWFITDEEARVLRTGVDSSEGLVARLQEEHPGDASDFALFFDAEAADGSTIPVVWIVPPPPAGVLPMGS